MDQGWELPQAKDHLGSGSGPRGPGNQRPDPPATQGPAVLPATGAWMKASQGKGLDASLR